MFDLVKKSAMKKENGGEGSSSDFSWIEVGSKAIAFDQPILNQ